MVGLHHSPDCTAGTNHNYFTIFYFLLFFPICNGYFLIIDQCISFFISVIDTDIWTNVLDDCIIFLIWAAGVLLNFDLKQKQRFSALLRMSLSSPSVEEFGLVFFTYISKNKKKNTKTIQVSKATSSIKRSFASEDIHYNNRLNTKVQE